MKRTYALLMFTVLFVNSAGFYVFYIVQLKKIHAAMREQLKHLPEDQLEVLTMNYHDFLASRVEEHEVKVNGKMYDIARVERSGDVVKVFCIHDALEDNFLALFAELVSKPIEESSIPVTVEQFIDLNFLVDVSGITLRNSFVQIIPCCHYQSSTGTFVATILTPPPRP